MNSSNDDCYFYYYSTCTKGNDCPFRHCELALGTETVCTQWREGLCVRKNCKFRHMESRINRATIPCYWENQPGGCRKPHCVFLHLRGHGATSFHIENKNIILPVAPQTPSQTPISVSPESMPDVAKGFSGNEIPEAVARSPPSVPVEPVVVSLNDGEESDTESMSSTPAKSYPSVRETQNKHIQRNTDNSDDLGIKTLEQIKMEKIHRESEHFYKSVYDAPSLENVVPMKRKAEKPCYLRELFGKASTFSAEEHVFQPYTDEYSAPIIDCDSSLDEKDLSNDLRVVLQRRQESSKQSELPYPVTGPKKRVISLKRAAQDSNCDSTSITVTVSKEMKTEGALDFQVKTLAEIKKEKSQAEKSDELHSVSEDVANFKQDLQKGVLNNSRRIMRTRIKRPAQQLYSVKPVLSNGNSLTMKCQFDKADSETKRQKLSNSEPNHQNSAEQDKETEDKAKENTKFNTLPLRRILRLKKMSLTAGSKSTKEIISENLSASPPKIVTSNKHSDKSDTLEHSQHSEFKCRSPLTQLEEENPSSLESRSLLQISHESEHNKSESSNESHCSPSGLGSTSLLQNHKQFHDEGKCNTDVASSEPVASSCRNSDPEPFIISKLTVSGNSPHSTQNNESEVPVMSKETDRSSIDEFDSFLMGDDDDMTLEDVDEKTEDIFLELEEMLQS